MLYFAESVLHVTWRRDARAMLADIRKQIGPQDLMITRYDRLGNPIHLQDEVQCDELGPEWRMVVSFKGLHDVVVMLEWDAIPGLETRPVSDKPRPYAMRASNCVSRPSSTH